VRGGGSGTAITRDILPFLEIRERLRRSPLLNPVTSLIHDELLYRGGL
jgi:hypothetical protein